jgi:hypothetical protein
MFSEVLGIGTTADVAEITGVGELKPNPFRPLKPTNKGKPPDHPHQWFSKEQHLANQV